MVHLLFIAIGGGFGALARYSCSRLAYRLIPEMFPWGTLIVNLAGCFLLGFFYDLFSNVIVSNDLKAAITIGFIGAFTTFSTYSLETVNLIRDGELKLGILNMMLNNVTGITLVIIGILLSRLFLKAIK